MRNNISKRGYDMEELHVLRAKNSLRIEIEKERIRNMFSPSVSSTQNTDKIFTTVASIAEAADYGIKTYKIVKKISEIFRKNKK